VTPLLLALALVVGLGLLAISLNHVYARLALVELALNEGLPPGHQQEAYEAVPPDTAALVDGVHVFLSRGCHACQRLIKELASTKLLLGAQLHLHYIDRARPVAHEAATALRATIDEHQAELTKSVGADPLPYTIAVGEHRLVSRAVTPTIDVLLAATRDAGISAERGASI